MFPDLPRSEAARSSTCTLLGNGNKFPLNNSPYNGCSTTAEEAITCVKMGKNHADDFTD